MSEAELPDDVADHLRAKLLGLAWTYTRGLNAENIGNHPAARRAVEAGADAADVATAMSAAAYEAVFELLYVLDEGDDPYGNSEDVETAPSWAVVVQPTRERLVGLHEGVLSADPTGREGSDLFR